MGFGYGPRRGRLQEIKSSDPLVWYGLGNRQETNPFEKADYQEVARVVNRQLDKADQRLKDLFDDKK